MQKGESGEGRPVRGDSVCEGADKQGRVQGSAGALCHPWTKPDMNQVSQLGLCPLMVLLWAVLLRAWPVGILTSPISQADFCEPFVYSALGHWRLIRPEPRHRDEKSTTHLI